MNPNFEKLTPPYVSIVVPVYNVEGLLRTCLTSVVHQTLPEIEVIIVNDASPDNSQKIIDEFVERFPGKVRCIVHEQNQGLAYARRTGLRNAKAPYVIFVDSDDFVSPYLCEIMLSQILEHDSNMVHCPALRVWEDRDQSDLFIPAGDHPGERIRNGWVYYWGTIYNCEFLLKNEDIAFIPILYEDAASVPALWSRTDKVSAYCEKPLYFYRFRRKGSICHQGMSESGMNGFLSANLICMRNMRAEFMADYAYRAIKRTAVMLRDNLSVYDYAVLHAKELIRQLPEPNEAIPSSLQIHWDTALALPDEIQIPKTVYVNGFVRSKLIDFDAYLAEAQQAYLFHPQIIVLDETNCDLSGLPGWLKNASPEEKGLYFALQHIRRSGGIYITPEIKVVTSFNREAFTGAFFAAGPENTVLPCVFGAAPNNALMHRICESVHEPSVLWARSSIADCIARVLVEYAGVHLNCREEQGLHGLHMLPFPGIFRGLNPDRNYCILDDSNYKNPPCSSDVCLQTLQDLSWQLAFEDHFRLEAEKKEETKRVRELAGTNRTLRADLRSMREEMRTVRDASKAFKAERDAAKDAAKAAKAERDAAKETLASTKKELSAAQNELLAIKSHILYRIFSRLCSLFRKKQSLQILILLIMGFSLCTPVHKLNPAGWVF